MDKKGRHHVLVGVPFRHRFARRDYRASQTLSSPISEALILKRTESKSIVALSSVSTYRIESMCVRSGKCHPQNCLAESVTLFG